MREVNFANVDKSVNSKTTKDMKSHEGDLYEIFFASCSSL